MPIRILNECLHRAIGTCPPGQPSCAPLVQMGFPLVERIDNKRKMAAAMMRMNGLVAVPNQMKLLVVTELKPSPRKVKVGSVHHGQPQGIAVKGDTRIDVGNVDRDVVQLRNFHGRL